MVGKYVHTLVYEKCFTEDIQCVLISDIHFLRTPLITDINYIGYMATVFQYNVLVSGMFL